MNNKQKIETLLSTEGIDNQELAIQLLQSQWHFTYLNSLLFVLDYYCDNNFEKIIIPIGNSILYYEIELTHDYCSNTLRWYLELNYRLESNQKIVQQKLLYHDNHPKQEEQRIKDYKNLIDAHFEENIYRIIKSADVGL